MRLIYKDVYIQMRLITDPGGFLIGGLLGQIRRQ